MASSIQVTRWNLEFLIRVRSRLIIHILCAAPTGIYMDPSSNRGARPATEGIPKITILITDGKSNQHPLMYAVPNIKSLGVQVYTIGIANPDVSELQFISSDPDEEHVFLFKSYNDAAGFVDFLSVQTCHSEHTVRLLELLVL